MAEDWIDNFVRETDGIPSSRIYRLWAAITAVSGALERKTWMDSAGTNLSPGLFTLLVGPPASGKTTAINRVRDLWRKCKGLNVAPDNVTKAALIDVLERSLKEDTMEKGKDSLWSSPLCAHASEFGVFCPKHDLEFLSVLNYLYDDPPTYEEERRTDDKKVNVVRPHLVILAGTQPDFLSSFMPEEAWGMGFTSRLLMIYSDEEMDINPFKALPRLSSNLAESLNTIFKVKGQFMWTKEAADAYLTWGKTGFAPKPIHNKLLHYVSRRKEYILKLSMISSASRWNKFVVDLFDVTRARNWLLEAEKNMAKIFDVMSQKSDIQILSDLQIYCYNLYMSSGKRVKITEDILWSFLKDRVVSERIPRIIETAEKSNILQETAYPDEWIPADPKSILN
jgi:hypothetical protein